jgi:hypothetical protein
VSIPWIVQEELVAQRVLRHAEAHSAAVSATRDLNRVAPWLHELGPKPFNRSEASDYWRQAYERLFEIVETSGEVARQALLREANCEKPAKGADAKDKGGARDAAIWLSVVEYLKSNPDEKVYFVTANMRDFGNGSEFGAPMAEDIKGLEDRLAFLTSFGSVVSAFSTPLDIDEEHIEKNLAGGPANVAVVVHGRAPPPAPYGPAVSPSDRQRAGNPASQRQVQAELLRLRVAGRHSDDLRTNRGRWRARHPDRAAARSKSEPGCNRVGHAVAERLSGTLQTAGTQMATASASMRPLKRQPGRPRRGELMNRSSTLLVTSYTCKSGPLRGT